MKKFWKSNQKIIKFILVVFIVWQIVIILISFFSSKILPERSRFMYNDGNRIINPTWLWNRANFDGAHYLEISRKGYGLYQQAFFPLYPKIIKFLTPIFGGKDLLAALLVSNLSLIFILFFFYKIIVLDFNESVARRSILFFIFFPTSFFLSLVYGESLFIALMLGSFYFARKKIWLLAGILGFLASYTRLVGIFIFPALLYEWFEQNKNNKTKIGSLIPVFLIPLGLLSYMVFLWKKFQDPLLFFHVQPFFGAERSSSRIILIYQVFWRYFKMIFTTKLDPLYFAVWLELLVAIFFLVLLTLSYKKEIRISYLIFGFFSYIVPTLSGTFLSLPRFVLTLFPCFILLGTAKNKPLKIFLLVLFGFMFIVSASLFFRGYWVA